LYKRRRKINILILLILILFLYLIQPFVAASLAISRQVTGTSM
jgi:hypothetical protein